MGRHAAPGPPDRPAPQSAAARQWAPEENEQPADVRPARPAERPTPAAQTDSPRPEQAPDGPPVSATHTMSLLASLVLGVVVGLAAGGVLWWAGQPLVVAGAAAGGTLVVVVLAAWVARSAAARHPLQ